MRPLLASPGAHLLPMIVKAKCLVGLVGLFEVEIVIILLKLIMLVLLWYYNLWMLLDVSVMLFCLSVMDKFLFSHISGFYG